MPVNDVAATRIAKPRTRQQRQEKALAPNQLEKHLVAPSFSITVRTGLGLSGPDQDIRSALHILHTSRRVAVLSGAGISISAGMPPLRGPHGIEDYLSFHHKYSRNRPQWYAKMGDLTETARNATPTPFHDMLIALGSRLCIHFTQNFDGLEIRATEMEGKTLSLHGRLMDLRCEKNAAHRRSWKEAKPGDECRDCEANRDDGRLPRKAKSSNMRPDIVLHGEVTPETVGRNLSKWLDQDIDVLLIVGTSLKIRSCFTFATEMSAAVRHAGGTVIRIDPRRATQGVSRMLDIDLPMLANEVAGRFDAVGFS